MPPRGLIQYAIDRDFAKCPIRPNRLCRREWQPEAYQQRCCAHARCKDTLRARIAGAWARAFCLSCSVYRGHFASQPVTIRLESVLRLRALAALSHYTDREFLATTMYIELLQDLGIVLVAASFVAVLFRWLRQPIIIGYTLAGILIGPYLLPVPLVQDQETVKTLAELGVMMLMFNHGMHFNFRRLFQVGVPAVVIAVVQIIVMVWAGIGLARLFGWEAMDGLFLGALLSISSATIVYKVLIELNQVNEKFSAIAFGVLVVEDALAIAMLALLSSVAMTGSLQAVAIADTFVRLGIFLVIAPVVGLILVPRLLARVGRLKSLEVLLVVTLGLCFGVTLFALQLGYSVALGAFIIGALVSEARESARINEIIEPVRNMFSAVFFIAVGMMVDPAKLVEYATPILVITAVVIVGKSVVYSLAAALCGRSPRTSLKVGLTLAQIGEFSFIIASVGLTLGVTSDFLYPITVAVSILTTFVSPYLIYHADTFAGLIWRFTPAPFARAVTVYSRLGPPTGMKTATPATRRLVRRWILQIGFNLAAIAAVFLFAFEASRHPEWLPFVVPDWLGGHETLFWFAAIMLVLPVFVAIFNKLQAVSMFVAEAAMTAKQDSVPNYSIRALMANVVLIFSTLLVGLFVLILSGALLPPLPVLAVLGVFVLILMNRLRNHFVRVYARAQIALEETLANPPPAHEPPREMAPLLEEIRMELVRLAPGAWASGNEIREIALRGRSGASIVAIARGEDRIINPDAYEELQDNDGLLLIGTEAQLARGKELLSTRMPPPPVKNS